MTNITDQELLDALTTSSADARAVLGLLAALPGATGNVTVTLKNGTSFAVPGLAKIAADRLTDQQGYALDFSAAQPCGITRDASGRVSQMVTTFQSGMTLTESRTRDAAGRIATSTHVLKSAAGVMLATVTRTYNRNAAGRLMSIS